MNGVPFKVKCIFLVIIYCTSII